MDFLNNLDTGMQFLHRYLLSKCDIAQQNEIIICLVRKSVSTYCWDPMYNGDRNKK